MRKFEKIKRRCITLMEMIIVIFIIGFLMGVLAYNYTGTLEKGKAFKTVAAIERTESVLNLAIAQNPKLEDDVEANWQKIVKGSPLVKNPDAVIKDGWGVPLDVKVENGRLVITSKRLEEYKRAHPDQVQ